MSYIAVASLFHFSCSRYVSGAVVALNFLSWGGGGTVAVHGTVSASQEGQRPRSTVAHNNFLRSSGAFNRDASYDMVPQKYPN